MAQLSKGETITDVAPGNAVTSTRLNNLVDNATVLVGAITDQTALGTGLAATDDFIVSDTSATALKKVQAQNLLVPEAITGKTDISTSIAAGDLLLMADISASNALMKVQAQHLLTPEAITNKTELTSGQTATDDLVVVSDTSASAALKKVTLANLLPASAFSTAAPSGSILQQVATSTAAMSTIAAATPGGTIPIDDTVPASNEGTQLLSQAITASNTSNILNIEVVIPASTATGGAQIVASLLQDGTCVAVVKATSFNHTGLDTSLHIRHRQTAGTTSASTFTVRVGTDTGTATINGYGGARLFGGTSNARLIITEHKA